MGLTIVCACVAANAWWSAAAQAREALVASFDGTRIVVHFHPARGAAAGARAPTVLVGQGYPQRGDRRPDLDTSDRIGTATLRAAGYNVLTWDPRGLGASGGTVMFNSPDFEARDVSALIDFVAAQPEALLDAAADPRVGMSGSSYGGGIQFVSAAVDRRIDAIVPDVAWHSLLTSFFKDGAVKAGWLTLICGGGEAAALTGGLFFGAAGLQLGGTATELRTACLEALAGGRISASSSQWIANRGPGDRVATIRAPTLITQGTVDTLFTLGEAIANYDTLRRNHVPVKMLWYCGGHGACRTPPGDPRHVARAGLAWFARWLKRDTSIDTGARFEWIADDGLWRSGPDYPLAPIGSLDASGAGSLRILPLDGVVPARAADGTTVPFSSPTSAGDIVGAPVVKLVYRGTGVPSRTFLYAHIRAGNRVAGDQTTPIPVVLDGRTHTIERSLEALALRAGTETRLRLQLRSGASAYGAQRSLGNVRLMSIHASLPVVDATRAARRASSVKHTPPRLQISVTSRHARANSELELRSRLRSAPCAGSVRFTIRSGPIKRITRAAVAPSCAIRTVLRLRIRPRRTIRVSALFEGNDELTPRRANSRVWRVR